MEFIYLVFTRVPGESYRRRLRSLILCLCDVFRGPVNSLVCWFCSSALGLVLFQTVGVQFKFKQKHQLLWAKDHWKHIQPVDHINCKPARSGAVDWLIDDRFYIALFSALEQTHCALLTFPVVSCRTVGAKANFLSCYEFHVGIIFSYSIAHNTTSSMTEIPRRRKADAGAAGNTAFGLQQCVGVLGNGCTRYCLTQYW